MNILTRFKRFYARHWNVFMHRPTNGHASMNDIDDALGEMRENTERVCEAVKVIVANTKSAQRMIEDVPHTDNS